MISKIISELKQKNNLNYHDIQLVMDRILKGQTTDQENEDFLNFLTDKGETDEELLGMLDKMQEYALKVNPRNEGKVIDVCGTGGDKLQTFNISTTASFVIVAAGGIVAKHGNRSSSGISGSADIFEYFDYDLNQNPKQIEDMLEKHNFCFMFAQKFHPAMKHIANARKKIKRRTAFNLLGPLSNPAQIKNQLIGVFSIEYLDRLPLLLKQRGAQNIMTVRSDDGMDEFSTSAVNRVCILKENRVLTNAIDPEVLGLHKSSLNEIQINTKDDAVRSFVSVLNNSANKAMIETTALNAAAGLIIADVVKNFEEGIEIAMNVIENGDAYKVLEKFIKEYGNMRKLQEIQE